MTKRLFLGFSVSKSFIDYYRELKGSCDSLIIDPSKEISWVPEANLHLTVQFLGNVEEELLPDVVKNVKNSCVNFLPFRLLSSHLAILNQDTSSHHIVLAYRTDDIFTELVKRTAYLMIDPNTYAIFPHVTLARTTTTIELKKQWFTDGDVQKTYIDALVLHLFQSRLGTTHPTYTILDSFQFIG